MQGLTTDSFICLDEDKNQNSMKLKYSFLNLSGKSNLFDKKIPKTRTHIIGENQRINLSDRYQNIEKEYKD